MGITDSWHDPCNSYDMGRGRQAAIEFSGPGFARRRAVIMISRPEFAEYHRHTRSGIPGPCDGDAQPAFSWPTNEIMLRSLVRTGHSFAEIGARHGVDDSQIAELRNHYDV